ncbi:MAG: hypothetical protein AAFR55_02985 [Pseudomonadota bacterium]
MFEKAAMADTMGHDLTASDLAPRASGAFRHVASKRRNRAAEEREFKVTVAILTAVIAPFALAAVVLPRRLHPFATDGGSRSPLAQARATANEIAPFILCR